MAIKSKKVQSLPKDLKRVAQQLIDEKFPDDAEGEVLEKGYKATYDRYVVDPSIDIAREEMERHNRRLREEQMHQAQQMGYMGTAAYKPQYVPRLADMTRYSVEFISRFTGKKQLVEVVVHQGENPSYKLDKMRHELEMRFGEPYDYRMRDKRPW